MERFDGIAVLFDLDGTLVDTAPDLAGAMNAVLAGAGRRTLPVDEVRHLVGRGARALIERGFEATGAPVEEDATPALIAQFLDHYREHIADASALYPCAGETLDALIADGARLATCTNKPEGLARLLLHRLGVFEKFEAIVGGDSLPVRKPDPGPLKECVVRLGTKGGAVMVGDSTADSEAARAFGCPFVWAAFGYADAAPEVLAPDATARSFLQIPDTIREALGG